MRLFRHFFASAVLAAGLYPFFGSYSFLVFLTGFFIDIDHYFYYVIAYKKFNPFKANRLFIDYRLCDILCVFHTFEFFVVVAIFAFFSKVGLMLLFGLLLHQAMDFYNENKLGRQDAKARLITGYLLRKVK